MLAYGWTSYFTDPVLRGPTVGSMLMCLGAALIGVLVFLRRRSLIGESLSHAAYPGVILGALGAGVLAIGDEDEVLVTIFMMIGGSVTALLGMWLIDYLETKWRVRSDSALCFVLSVFFGMGVTLASQMQFTYTSLYKKIQAYLYGQAATMTDVHVLVYGVLSLVIIIAIVLFYKELQIAAFDRLYAASIGISMRWTEGILLILTILALVIGIRSVGVVLMSAMLIAPAVAARQFTDRLSKMFWISAFFGVLSAFVGTYLSIDVSLRFSEAYPQERFSLPTGPMIVLVASILCLLALLFSPKRGLIFRICRIGYFRYQCVCENLLKSFWRLAGDNALSFEEIEKYQSVSPLYLRFILSRLVRMGWLERVPNGDYCLTVDGRLRAAHIVRLHRLWEVYLVDYFGLGVERVHRSAEEMEHIITPEIEKELTMLLDDPKYDPHHQPIPSRRE